jgi:hypothetical protein
MKNRHSALSIALAACMFFAGTAAHAQRDAQSNAQSDATRAGYIMTDEQIDARYDAAIEQCNGMEGDRQDLCEKEAQTARDKARADAEMHERASQAQKEAAEKKADADYELGKARCDAMSGNEAKTCRADLDARFNRN